MSYFKNKKAYSATCGWKRDYRNNDEKIHNTRNNLQIWGTLGLYMFHQAKLSLCIWICDEETVLFSKRIRL